MQTVKHYLKAINALLVQLFAMLLTWYVTGTYSEAEVIQTLTAILSALLVAYTTNSQTPEARNPSLRA